MIVKQSYIKRWDVSTCPSSASAAEALLFLRKTGFRCVPVVDKTTNAYIGQIYKSHLLEYLFEEEGDPHANVKTLARTEGTTIGEERSLARALLVLKRHPFLSVVDETGQFLGILPHSIVMDLFRDGFESDREGICFTVGVTEQRGVFKRLLDVLKPYNIEGVHTFDNGSKTVRRITFTVSGVDIERANQLVSSIEKVGGRVVHMESVGIEQKTTH